MKIQTFGIARDITGSTEVNLPHPVTTVSELRKQLLACYPALADIGSFRLAVNEEFAREDDPVRSQDEVAIIPPVSGG